MLNNSTNINKMNNDLSPEERLNCDGQQFYQYQQNKNHLSPKERLNCDGQQFHQYQQNEQLPLTWRKIKLWWSTIPPISTKWTIISHPKKV